MAQLSEETIKELQRILKEEYGVEYTFAEASKAARNLAGRAQPPLTLAEVDPSSHQKK